MSLDVSSRLRFRTIYRSINSIDTALELTKFEHLWNVLSYSPAGRVALVYPYTIVRQETVTYELFT